MPSIGRFLELFEAISRRDWKSVREIGEIVAEEEQKKKHYTAAHRIIEALEVATSNSGFDRIGTVASPVKTINSPIPDLLREEKNDAVEAPILESILKKEIQDFIGEWQFEERLLTKGLRPRRTVLLHGPPGCGKTHLAKFLASSLEMRMFTVMFDSLISSFLGETGLNLRKVFDFISSNRCVLFIDEIDAIAKLRDDRNELGELKRVVISLLQNLDLTQTKSLIIAATNHPHMLDPALWRRFEVVWEVEPPNAQLRKQLIENYLKEKISEKWSKFMENSTKNLSGSDISQICNSAQRRRFLKEDLTLEEAFFLSILEHLRRNDNLQGQANEVEDRIIEATLALRELKESKYSFQDLENLSGIPKSTLHYRQNKAHNPA